MAEGKNSKRDFYFGLITGIAISAVIGFVIMLVMYVNKGEEIEYDKDIVDYEEYEKEPVVKEVDMKLTDNDQIKGSKDGSVTIIDYSDYQCPYCASFNSTMKRVVDEYDGKVKWVRRHFPLDSIHKYARGAAEAAECAGDQGKFWEYSDELFENQSKINDSLYAELAEGLELNMDDFDKCIDSGKYKDKVNNDYKGGAMNGVSGTPAIFINGEPVKGGALPYEELKDVINELL